MPARTAGRSGRPWRRLSAQVYAEETHCIRCGRWVDQSLPPNTRMSRTVDHIDALAMGGARLKRENVGLAHHGCNSRAGARMRWSRTHPITPPGVCISIDPASL